MGTRRKLIVLGLVVVALVWLGIGAARRIFERPVVDSDHIIFTPQEDYRLSGTVNEPLVVIGNEVELADEGAVQGDTALVGDSVLVGGSVEGDLTMMGDNLTINENAHVSGDASLIGDSSVVEGQIDGGLTVIGHSLTIRASAQISGDIVACVESVTDERTARRNVGIRKCSDSEAIATFAQTLEGGPVGGGLSALALLGSAFTSLVLSGVSALVVAAFPRHISYIEDAVLTIPRRMGRIGLLTVLLAIGISVALLVIVAIVPPIGVVLLPVFLLAGLALLAMTVTGWITVALVLGNWLLRRSNRTVLPPLVVATVGSILLFIFWHILALIPLGLPIALLLMAALGSVGLGAVVKTRLGTRPVRRSYFVQG